MMTKLYIQDAYRHIGNLPAGAESPVQSVTGVDLPCPPLTYRDGAYDALRWVLTGVSSRCLHKLLTEPSS